MPVRSSTSSVLVWPSRATVAEALHAWATRQGARRPDLLHLGCFGSFVRADWGVGSDLDLIAIVRASNDRFDRRAAGWDLTHLPVPADLVVYTEAEWVAMRQRGSRLVRTVEREAEWLLGDSPAPRAQA